MYIVWRLHVRGLWEPPVYKTYVYVQLNNDLCHEGLFNMQAGYMDTSSFYWSVLRLMHTNINFAVAQALQIFPRLPHPNF